MSKLPDTGRMYRALAARDPAFEGVFFVAVKTTGVFCRPTCSARTPRRENVEFFATAGEAARAGYRACLRCRPGETTPARPEWVARLLAEVERRAGAGARVRDEDLRRLEIDPSTVRRYFQKHYGMTFHAFHRARRMGTALRSVKGGRSVMEASMSTGFGSESGFRDAFAKVFGAPPARGRDTACVMARWIATPLGDMLALADDKGLRLLDFIDGEGIERLIMDVRKRLSCVVVPGEHEHLDQIAKELERYFAVGEARFEVPLAPLGTEFQMRVWRELLTIPAGATRSYSEVARGIGRASAVRAVARANATNRIALVIPCHRVIGANGAPVGYAGGIWRKKWLLEHERGATGSARGAEIGVRRSAPALCA